MKFWPFFPLTFTYLVQLASYFQQTRSFQGCPVQSWTQNPKFLPKFPRFLLIYVYPSALSLKNSFFTCLFYDFFRFITQKYAFFKIFQKVLCEGFSFLCIFITYDPRYNAPVPVWVFKRLWIKKFAAHCGTYYKVPSNCKKSKVLQEEKKTCKQRMFLKTARRVL